MPSSTAASVTQAPGAVRTGTTVRARGGARSGAATATASVRAAGSTPTQVRPMARPGRVPSPPGRNTCTAT